jgi:hypothetical protein
MNSKREIFDALRRKIGWEPWPGYNRQRQLPKDHARAAAGEKDEAYAPLDYRCGLCGEPAHNGECFREPGIEG